MTSDIQKEALAAITRAVNEVKRMKMEQTDTSKQLIIAAVNVALAPLLVPYLNQIIKNSSVNQGEIQRAVSGALDELKIGIKDALSNLKLDSIVHDIKLPEIQVPNIPDVRVSIDTSGIEAAVERAVSRIVIHPPVVNVPALTMPDRMNVGLGDVSNQRPLATRLVDEAGKRSEERR